MRTSLQDTAGLPDPLLSYNFDLLFTRVPGNSGNAGRELTIKCQSSALPGLQLEQQTLGLHGVEVSYAGRQLWNKTFQAQFVETRDGNTRRAFKNWVEFARNNRRGTGTYKRDYAVDAIMRLYDDVPNAIETSKIVGTFPTQVDDLSMDGSQGNIVMVSVTFSYDWVEPSL